MNRLYIIEGLPCSGKSTTAGFVADWLAARGHSVHCVDEGTGEHPADYEFHALVGGQVVPLNQFPQEELPALLPYKIYDGLPWETEAPLMLDKWRQFVQEADPDTVYVFNCVLLQNPMCETMMRFGMSEAESAAHIRQIAEIIAPMGPVVIRLHVSDVASRVRETARERPGWLEAVIPYHVEGSYGRSIGAENFDGYVACLEERQRREEHILAELPLQAVTLRDAHRDWPSARAELAQALDGMDYEGTLTGCRRWATAGRLDEWVHHYLLSDGDNEAFSVGLKEEEAVFLGPVTMPMSLFTRCSGPVEEGLTFRVDAGWWAYKVERIMQAVQAGADLPPLIIGWRGDADAFELNDGNHRWEAFRQLGIGAYPVILWCHEEELPRLLEKYGHLMA